MLKNLQRLDRRPFLDRSRLGRSLFLERSKKGLELGKLLYLVSPLFILFYVKNCRTIYFNQFKKLPSFFPLQARDLSCATVKTQLDSISAIENNRKKPTAELDFDLFKSEICERSSPLQQVVFPPCFGEQCSAKSLFIALEISIKHQRQICRF